MTAGSAEIWSVILILGVGTFLIRFSFLGIIGSRKLPEWALRHLRYVPLAVMPGIIAPMVIWPAATGGAPDPARIVAALVTATTGYLTRNTLAAIAAGGASLYIGLYLTGQLFG